MSNRVGEPPREHRDRDVCAPARPEPGSSGSVRSAALVAGIGLMVMAAIAGFGNLVVVDGLVTPGDAAQTAVDIRASSGLFRLGVACLYVVVVLDVVVAWALLRVFSPASRDVSRLAAWFRLAYAAVLMVAVSQLAGIPDLLDSGAAYSSVYTAEQVQAQALLKTDAFSDIWMAGLILFGVHLVLLGYLAYGSGYVPKVLGVLVVIAGIGYGFDSFASVFVEDVSIEISTVTFLGEFLLGIWLLVRGRRISLGTDGHAV